jgi:hypothetical protein
MAGLAGGTAAVAAAAAQCAVGARSGILPVAPRRSGTGCARARAVKDRASADVTADVTAPRKRRRTWRRLGTRLLRVLLRPAAAFECKDRKRDPDETLGVFHLASALPPERCLHLRRRRPRVRRIAIPKGAVVA